MTERRQERGSIMVNRIGWVAAGLLATALAPVARAQEPPVAPPPLSLQTALDEALEHNPTLVALRREHEAATTRPAQALSLPPPMIEAQIWQWPINTINPADANMYMFMIGQELPGRGKRALRESLAVKDAALAEADVAVRARAVVDEVKRAYAALFLARKSREVFEDNLTLVRQLVDISHAKYETGRISQQDVLKAVVELSRLHEEIIGVEERARLAEAELNALLDRPVGSPIGALAEPRTQVVLPDVARLQAQALDAQPELAAARLALERADTSLAVEQSGYKPDFFVQGGYMVMPGMTDAWMARAGISWPKAPWSRGRLDAKVAEATADVAARRAALAAAERAVGLAVEQAYIRVQAAQARADLIRTSLVPQSTQVLDVSRVAYQTDRVDFLALIDSQRVLLAVQLDYHRALADLEQATADLERAVGVDFDAGGPAARPTQGESR